MPPQFLFDLSKIDLNHVLQSEADEIRQMNPHRGNMEMLQGIIILGRHRARARFWVTRMWGRMNSGLPATSQAGRLFPGVLMIQRQRRSLLRFTRKNAWPGTGFVGFGAGRKIAPLSGTGRAWAE